jgi:hypothetical protein
MIGINLVPPSFLTELEVNIVVWVTDERMSEKLWSLFLIQKIDFKLDRGLLECLTYTRFYSTAIRCLLEYCADFIMVELFELLLEVVKRFTFSIVPFITYRSRSKRFQKAT